MKDILKIIVLVSSMLIVSFFIATFLFCGILPTTAYYAKEVKDSTGTYALINNKFKAVYDKTEDENYARWHLYRNDKCLPVWTYATTHTSKYSLITYLMGCYRWDYDDKPAYVIK